MIRRQHLDLDLPLQYLKHFVAIGVHLPGRWTSGRRPKYAGLSGIESRQLVKLHLRQGVGDGCRIVRLQLFHRRAPFVEELVCDATQRDAHEPPARRAARHDEVHAGLAVMNYSAAGAAG